MLRESKQMNEDILRMFGDDLNPSVMTERFRFGAVSDMHTRGAASWQERLGGRTKGKRKHGWTQGGQQKQGGTRLTVGASNDLQMERNLTGGLPVLYQGHSANLGPF